MLLSEESCVNYSDNNQVTNGLFLILWIAVNESSDLPNLFILEEF